MDKLEKLVKGIKEAILVLNQVDHGSYRIIEYHAEERARNIAAWIHLESMTSDESLNSLSLKRKRWAKRLTALCNDFGSINQNNEEDRQVVIVLAELAAMSTKAGL